jgi:hypothetical protein
MQTRIESNPRRSARWAMLSAVAAIALFANLPVAQAADQQRSEEAPDLALSQAVAGTGPYAQAPAPAPRRHHRDER